MRSYVPIWVWCWFFTGIAAFIVVGVVMANSDPDSYQVKVEVPRTAVALEFVVERDAEGNVVKIHRFTQWSNGDVTFPNLPYYASLRLNCRDCPEQVTICPADIDGDGIIGAADLVIMMAAWGTCTP